MQITRREALEHILKNSSLAITGLLSRPVRFPVFETPTEPAQFERQEVKHIAQDFMQKFGAPALSVAIGHNGQITYLGAFGVPSRDSHEQLTASHTFRIDRKSTRLNSSHGYISY